MTIRDAGGGNFGEDGSSAISFSYRQDAAIDASTFDDNSDLPILEQFGLDPLTGFRATGDIEYKVQSDQGNIDLDDGLDATNEALRFTNSSLSLIGVDQNSAPAIDVSNSLSSSFDFIGKRVEIGGIADFEFTQTLARAFNRSAASSQLDWASIQRMSWLA